MISEYSTILQAQMSWLGSMCTLAAQCHKALSQQLQRSSYLKELDNKYGDEMCFQCFQKNSLKIQHSQGFNIWFAYDFFHVFIDASENVPNF